MTEMMSRVMSAIDATYDAPRGEIANLEEVARAVINTLRDPTDAMLMGIAAAMSSRAPAGPNPTNSLDRMNLLAKHMWAGGIDAALADTPSTLEG